MNQGILSLCLALALLGLTSTLSTASAKTKITIYKVSKVSPGDKLHLRAWPSPKSRIKTSLPFNAKDLTETGKKRKIGKTTWLEVNWKEQRGWVNGHYLVKTGVLLHPKPTMIAAKKVNRNTQQKQLSATQQGTVKAIIPEAPLAEMPPQEFVGDRYDQPVQLVASEVKTAFSPNAKSGPNKQLICSGSDPRPWQVTMNMANKKMQVQLFKNKRFSVPINYHDWASPTHVRMNLGGNKGRNIVDVNLEKTDACSNGLSKKNYTYEINATINRQFYSGCCSVASQ